MLMSSRRSAHLEGYNRFEPQNPPEPDRAPRRPEKKCALPWHSPPADVGSLSSSAPWDACTAGRGQGGQDGCHNEPWGPQLPRLGLAVLLTLAAIVRCYHLGAPLADSMEAKQIFVANRARSIARPPFDPLRNTLDFLDENGRRMELTEEIPIYTNLLGAAFRLFGEREWIGHGLSLLGMLAAIIAFHDLMQRQYGLRFP